MDIKQLLYFKTIVDEGNITKAAKTLHIAQPPLSQQLKRLETELDTVLIKRYTHKWELTETGRILYRHAVNMLQDMKEVKREINEMEDGTSGTLSIGVTSSCVGFLPKNIQRFRESYPHVFIKIWKGDSSYLQNLLLERKIELSLMLLPTSFQDYHVKLLPKYPFVVVIPASWKSKFPNGTVSLKEIIDYPFLMLGPMKGYIMYETIMREFYMHKFSPNIVMECIDISTLLSFVALGIGISIIPKSDIYGSFHQEIEALEIEDFSLFIEHAIIYRKEHTLNTAAKNFLKDFNI
ncbi:LysR family transcriptional regulator [Oceanobacillus arenosus]|uniref:LysR family transcriptional regulator n=1 Tax=Oceanobacillus arenosus TaxID=1229153 RepID=A0A3D8PKS7_9BACI|nr:LysR family transcriptional regulator [Oceanobacillus arenosus]RDW16087.1 LysR family transcriptional regulator [Oceanobacillus arenosus]